MPDSGQVILILSVAGKRRAGLASSGWQYGPSEKSRDVCGHNEVIAIKGEGQYFF
jgi:hypothetical protein